MFSMKFPEVLLIWKIDKEFDSPFGLRNADMQIITSLADVNASFWFPNQSPDPDLEHVPSRLHRTAPGIGASAFRSRLEWECFQV